MNTIPLDESIQQEPPQSELAILLGELDSIRKAKEPAEEDVRYWTEREAGLKADIQSLMQSTGIKTGEAHGIQVQLKTRKGHAVTDDAELLAAITEAGLLDDFLRFDKSAAAKYALQHEMPGVEATATTYLSVSEVK